MSRVPSATGGILRASLASARVLGPSVAAVRVLRPQQRRMLHWLLHQPRRRLRGPGGRSLRAWLNRWRSASVARTAAGTLCRLLVVFLVAGLKMARHRTDREGQHQDRRSPDDCSASTTRVHRCLLMLLPWNLKLS